MAVKLSNFRKEIGVAAPLSVTVMMWLVDTLY